MNYTEEPYEGGMSVPDLEMLDSVDAVPGYWEDMVDAFAYTRFYGQLRVTPDFGVLRHPVVFETPDTVLPNIYGTFYYRRTFVYEGEAGEKTIYFDGVQNTVSVWINGQYIDKHIGYSTSFELKVPDDVLKIGENTIDMVVSNYRLLGYEEQPIVGCTSRATTELTGGVTGDVELRIYSCPLRDVAFIVSEDCKTVCAEIDAEGSFTAKWEIYDGESVIKQGVCCENFTFDTEGMELWSPENPKLYRMVISCADGSIERAFGVRRLLADGVHFRFNGYPYMLRGVCEHGYYPETMHPNHDAKYYRKMIKSLKKIGFNFIRMHTYIPEEEFMQTADELGMVLHVESPNNTTLEEWKQIVKFCRRHTSVVIYCCGNELLLDDPFIEHMHKCADEVHAKTDALFSPMSALRGVEYWFHEEPELAHEVVNDPFMHNPRRFKMLDEFCDMYSSYALGHVSYRSTNGDYKLMESWRDIYKKPRASHEMGITGSYIDLNLKNRYKDSRLRYARLFESAEEHLAENGLLEKAPIFFRNSVELQRRIRKQCIEIARMCDSISGYDFLGPIDHQNHNMGYMGGIMNEFYELKPTETVRNVLMYNSETILLTDINKDVNFTSGSTLKAGIFASLYSKEDLTDGALNVVLTLDGRIIDRKRIALSKVETGTVSKIYDYEAALPEVEKPGAMKLYVSLDGIEQFVENEWELYLFPEPKQVDTGDLMVVTDITEEELYAAMKQGKKVVLLGKGPFETLPTRFINARPGRTHDDLATVIYDHPVFAGMPHEGFCGWQFNKMLDNGTAVCFLDDTVPFEPVLEMASSYKFALRRAAIFEYNILNGKLLVCGLNFDETDPASVWFKAQLLSYAASEQFNPQTEMDERDLFNLIHTKMVETPIALSAAMNPNDKSAKRKKKK